jgi:hypothetical protein
MKIKHSNQHWDQTPAAKCMIDLRLLTQQKEYDQQHSVILGEESKRFVVDSH